MAVTPNGQHIISGGIDGTVRVWNMLTGEPSGETWRGHTGAVNAIACSLDGCLVASGSDDSTVRLWKADMGSALQEPLKGHTDSVACVAVSPDSRTIASGSRDGSTRIWNATTGEVIKILGPPPLIYSLAYSADGRFLVAGSTKEAMILSTAGYRPICRPVRTDSFAETRVVVSHDSTFFATGSDTLIHVFDMPRKSEPAQKPSQNQRLWRARNRMDNSWIRNGNTLLLWVPPSFRDIIQAQPRLTIKGGTVKALPRINVKRLYRYSGTRWTDIGSLLDIPGSPGEM